MKKLISIVLTLTLLFAISTVSTMQAGAAKIETAPTATMQFIISDEPYADITPVNGYVLGYIGDADLDDTVSIMDATLIQMYAASLSELPEGAYDLADVDMDYDVSVMDATAIQQYMANIFNNEYITRTAYFDDRIEYTFDQIADYFLEYGDYDSESGYYSTYQEFSDLNYDLFMAYYPESNIIDFYSTFYVADSNSTVINLMRVSRSEPIFEYYTEMYIGESLFFETTGTAELVELAEGTFYIESTSLVSDYITDPIDIEDILASQFNLTISAADEILWDYITYYISDIFW